MKKGKLWAIVVLCSFFTQQIFAYSGEIIENNIEIVDSESTLEDVFIVEEIIEEQDKIILLEDVELIGSEENNQGESISIEGELDIEEDPEVEIITGEEILEGTGSIIKNNIIQEVDLDFKIKFQNPSYLLDKEDEKVAYKCDSYKDECKINLVLTDIEGINLSSKYSCLIEYSHGFESDNRCNPTTVILTENSTITFSVFHKDNPDNLIIKTLDFIKNNLEDENNEVEIIDVIVDESNDNETGSGTNLDEYINNSTGVLLEEGNSGTGNIIEDDLNSNENTNSGSIVIDEVSIEYEIVPMNLPEIVLTIQSGLEYSGTGNIYFCEKEDCKINLDVSESFTGGVLESDFNCRWDFGSGSFSTLGTDKKCNPGYVNYGTGIHEISINIISETDNSYFTGSTFSVINNILEDINNTKYNAIIEYTGSGSNNGNIIDNNSESESSTNSGSIGMTSTGELFIFGFPEIIINIQSGADYLNNETIKCNKEDCKINLDITDIFSEIFPEKYYDCSWNFGSGSFSSPDTINKCNPGYVDYNLGNDKIVFKLSEKNNSENFITQLLYIQNNKIIYQSKSSSGGGSIESNINKKDYGKVSLEKDIIIQSGLENNSCNSEECKINLNYENSSYETCTWNFSNIEVLEKYKNTCNPGFIYAGEGFHDIELKIFNSKTNKNYMKKLHFYNQYIKENIIQDVKFNIIMQGKELDYKKYFNNKIVCLGVEKCNINLNIETNSKNSLNYLWEFGNGEISESKNPKSIWYSSGSYEINLTISGENILEIKKINIEVIGNNISEKQLNIIAEIEGEVEKEKSIFTQFLKPSFLDIEFGFNTTDINIRKNAKNLIGNSIKSNGWFDHKQKNIKKLKLTRNISKQKKSLKYSGITFPNSNIYILQGDNIIELKSDDKGKYLKKTTDLLAGNYLLEYYVLDSYGNLYESNKPKLLELNNEYITNLSEKNKSNIAVKTKNNNNVVKSKIELKEVIHASIIPNIESNMSNGEYIFQLLLLLLSLLGVSILLKKYNIL